MSKRQQFRDGEKHLSQIPALHILQKMSPQWIMLSKAEVDRERRGKLSNVLLEDVLRSQLMKLNAIKLRGRRYPFSEANVLTAIEKLRSRGPLGLIKLNEQTTDLLQFGTALDQMVDGDTRGRSLMYIDWENPANNDFHVCKEFDVERAGSSKTQRPDIVLFVNGIPLCVTECKGPNEDFEEAVSQNIRNQGGEEIPQLFRSVQLLIATNKNKVQYGTVGTSRKFWAIWREKEFKDSDVAAVLKQPLAPDESRRTFGDGFEDEQRPFEYVMDGEREVTEQDRVLYALCRPDRLLDLARQFTLFDFGVKKVARYPQFFAVKNILVRVKQRETDGGRRGGIIWHTQGSGKSLTMVMLARGLALDKEIKNARVVHGGLGKATRRKLQTMAKALQTTGRVGPAPCLSLKPGARLVREWRGRTHTVTVTEDGFEYAGTTYPSLTKIAKRITGAHWSGPRFFGLLAAGAERPSNGGRDG
jgi:type I restriction enzyme R subunit